MNVEAIRKALNDAGIEKDAVDALYVKCPTSKFEMMYGQKMAEAIGLQPRIGGVWDSGGASNVIMISQAIMAIEAGQCEIAVVTFADNPKTGSAAGYSHPRGEDALYGWFGGVVFLCDDRAPPHGRARHAARGAWRSGCGRAAPRSAESERAVAQAAHARRVHGHAADGRAVLPRRLHTRLGRRQPPSW